MADAASVRQQFPAMGYADAGSVGHGDANFELLPDLIIGDLRRDNQVRHGFAVRIKYAIPTVPLVRGVVAVTTCSVAPESNARNTRQD